MRNSAGRASYRRSLGSDTIPARVHRFLTERTPEPVCDECVAEGASVPRENANPITEALSLTTDFVKARGICSLCRHMRLVTRSLRYATRRAAARRHDAKRIVDGLLSRSNGDTPRH